MASQPWLDKRSGKWVCKYRPDPGGPWVRVVLCKHPLPYPPSKPPKKPPQQALDRAAEFAEIEYRAKHGLQAAPARATGLAGYLTRYVEAFAATHDAGSTRQLRRHVRSLGGFCEARGITSVQGVTRSDCRDYLESRAAKVTPGSLHTERGYLRPIWTRAVEDGLVAANPWAGVKVPGVVVHKAPAFWTGEQVAAIVAACTKPWQADLVLLMANSGLRVSAALAMQWSWIDFEKGTISVPEQESKGGRPYTVAMTRVAREVLERRRAEMKGELVFPNPRNGGTVSYDSIRDAVGRAIKRAGVPPGTIHSLRHSYARALVLAGMPLPIVQRQLGHSTLAITQKYTDVTEMEAIRFVENWGIGDHQT